MPHVGKIVVAKGLREGMPARPKGVTACAIFFLAFGLVLLVFSALAQFPPQTTFKPLFDYRMSGNTFRLYAAVVGLGSLYVAYAFFQLQIAGLAVLTCAFLVQSLHYLLYFNWARGVTMVVDLVFYLLVLYAWLPVLKKMRG